MISSIHLESQKLDLLTRSNRPMGDAEGFFSVDSFSLLIGSNGAGKTRFLRQVAWAFHDEEEIIQADIHFSGSEVHSKNPRQDFGVIYYTPIPYRVDLPRSTRNFYNATPSYGKSEDQLDVNFQYYQVVSERLNFGLRPLVVLGFDRVAVLTAIGRVVLTHLSNHSKTKDVLFSPPGRERLRSVFSEFLDSSALLLRHFTNAFAAHLLADGENSEFSDDVSAEVQDIGINFMLRIQALIDSYLGDNRIAILSALEHVIHVSRKKTAPVEAFLSSYLLGGGPLLSVRDGGMSHQLERIATRKIEILNNGDSWSDYRADDWVGKSTYVDDDKKLKRYNESRTKPALVSLIWENFSSGQLALLYQFSAIRRAIDVLRRRKLRKFLILLDEGDIYLHAAWQREYVRLLDHMMGSMKEIPNVESIQLILTSHSTSLLTDVPRDCVTRLRRKQEHVDGPAEDVRSFAASLEDIVNSSFETGSLGSFAQEKINESIQRLKAKRANEMDDHLLTIIDDPILLREMRKLQAQND
ncbi:hypothetical protein AWB71_02810 [Caballeronia peredens]|nr:hypothetical protein AWB71_02810 [Caballeronia peredens]